MSETNNTIAKHLKESGGFSDKEKRVLITSGESFTPFFVNAEKLMRDPSLNSFLELNEKNPHAIIERAIQHYKTNSQFEEVIDIMANYVQQILPLDKDVLISGGMRRDLIFSAPIAYFFSLDHLSLFKTNPGDDPSKSPMIFTSMDSLKSHELSDRLDGIEVIHVADLLTKASSCFDYDNQSGMFSGWVPQLRYRGASVNNLVTAVSRLQGGEQRLIAAGIKPKSFVYIDENYVKEHSNQAEVCKKYLENDIEDTQSYILKNGVGVIVPFANPESKNVPRFEKFLDLYKNFLIGQGLLDELNDSIKEKYSKDMYQIIKESKNKRGN